MESEVWLLYATIIRASWFAQAAQSMDIAKLKTIVHTYRSYTNQNPVLTPKCKCAKWQVLK